MSREDGTCDLVWCKKPRVGKLCAGHASNKHAHGVPNPPSLAKIVGTRTLVAKTCNRCRLLKQGSEFITAKDGYHSAACRSCTTKRNSARQKERGYPGRDHERNNAYTRTYARAKQAESVPNATKHYQPYTQADWDVLNDPGLTLVEKAKKLNRTYKAVNNAIFKDRKKREEAGEL